MEKANKDLTKQCNAARIENCALHHQIRDLTAHKQEADQRVREIQVNPLRDEPHHIVVAIRCKDAFKCITSRLARIFDLASPAVSPLLLPCR